MKKIDYNYNKLVKRRQFKLSKKETLVSNGTYNKNYMKVKNKKFIEESFYDPMDIIQVKYEMLKDALYGNRSIMEIANEFGFSRASFYKIKNEFDKKGISAFIHDKVGPKEPYKLKDNFKEYIDKYIQNNPGVSSNEIAINLNKDKEVNISKRTIERYRSRKKLQ